MPAWRLTARRPAALLPGRAGAPPAAAGAVEVDLVPAHGHALAAEPLELGLAHRGGAVCAHHAVPGDIAVDRGEDAPDQARRRRLDVGVGAYESLRDRPHARQDAVGVA